MTKTPGQLAYEQDVANWPLYPDGGARKARDRLGDMAKQSWERNPTPRNWKRVSA